MYVVKYRSREDWDVAKENENLQNRFLQSIESLFRVKDQKEKQLVKACEARNDPNFAINRQDKAVRCCGFIINFRIIKNSFTETCFAITKPTLTWQWRWWWPHYC